jgi:hypothetical protein
MPRLGETQMIDVVVERGRTIAVAQHAHGISPPSDESQMPITAAGYA